MKREVTQSYTWRNNQTKSGVIKILLQQEHPYGWNCDITKFVKIFFVGSEDLIIAVWRLVRLPQDPVDTPRLVRRNQKNLFFLSWKEERRPMIKELP